MATLKSFFNWLVKAYPQMIQHNPTEPVSLEKLPLPPARDLLPEEVAALIEVLEYRGESQRRDTALLAILSHSLRASEVVGLNVGDYDGVRLTIREAKDDSTGTVPLSKASRTALDDYLQWRRQQGEPLFRAGSPGERSGVESFQQEMPLFVGQGRNNPGERLGYKGLYNVVRDLGRLAGVKNLTPHRLRHTYACNLLLLGMDSLHARTLTRHKSESSFQRYVKRAKAAAAERAYYLVIGEEPPGGTQ